MEGVDQGSFSHENLGMGRAQCLSFSTLPIPLDWRAWCAPIYEWRTDRLLKGSSVFILQLAADLGKPQPYRAAEETRSSVGEVCVIEKTTQGLERT